MIDGFKVDSGALAQVAFILQDAGRTLDSVGRRMPGTPDGGDVSAEMAAAIGHLAGSAGELVLGVIEAGGRVAKAGAGYVTQDNAVDQTFRGLE